MNITISTKVSTTYSIPYDVRNLRDLANRLDIGYQSLYFQLKSAGILSDVHTHLRENYRRSIIDAIENSRNMADAAKSLGLTHSGLLHSIERFRIHPLELDR